MPSGYIPIFIFLVIAILFPVATIIVAKLIRRHPHEYRRLLPVKGHVAAVQSLVRAHPRQYNGFLLEAVIEHDRLFGRGSASNSGSASGGPAMAGVAARAR